ncbi:TPA: DUF4222 domain-containing protein [Escherichia coli]|uniref:DUF4222 domain-containing protein n=1 Tax=Escherichia coli TaxID=562 RepID=UPI001808742C|nr:DUF4222 domain-containing protein [Escherichia coli]EEZ4278770.1 DUF4222 domain-containing protein [Escherichia coli]EFC9330910.1 DUF4222 domain-containing protein [Escherichia coli]EFD0055035.1 DUF4222 domain-containing protein [Escherichia coli]EFD0079897.1 DUF4222 domain-containing protein [Escherichia coli]EJH1481546.1 DUF4222 domain-containing protein [Escherichia coli]
MKQKNSGFTASGLPRPEIRSGDIFRDNYGGTVTIKSVAGRCVTYRRDGYGYDCVMPVYQFRRDFSLVQNATRGKPTSNAKARANIQKMKNMINAFRGKK